MTNSIGKTILEQMGGSRLAVMAGARNFLVGENFASFKLPSRFAKNGINFVRVTLLPSDTYRVEFLKVNFTAATSKTVSSFEDVYAEDLVRFFESETGLYLSL